MILRGLRGEPASIGISFTMGEGPGTNPELVGPSLAALQSRVWRKPLRYLLLQVVPGRSYPRRFGVLPGAERESVVRDMLVHPDVSEVALMTSKVVQHEFGELAVGTRARVSYPFAQCLGRQRIWGDTRAHDEWVVAMLDFAARLEVIQGVVPVMNESATFSEVALGVIVKDGVFRHPFPAEFRRMQESERRLGTDYVRFPRWGTIYPRVHVEQLGGVDRIREVVRPAVIRDLGPNAVYFQLTESVATAISNEALEKQRLFTELAEPLLPPPLLGEPSEAPDLSWLMEAAQNLGKEPPVTRRKRRKPVAGRKAAEAAEAARSADPERQPAGIESPDAEPAADDGEPKPEPFF